MIVFVSCTLTRMTNSKVIKLFVSHKNYEIQYMKYQHI